MKYVFSTKNVDVRSFAELCNVAKEYNFSGFEVYDAFAEKQAHTDSIFRSVSRVGSKRKLVNRHISVSALTFPTPVNGETSADDVVKYVDYAVRAGSENVILSVDDNATISDLLKVLTPAVKNAETLGVNLLFQTVGVYGGIYRSFLRR